MGLIGLSWYGRTQYQQLSLKTDQALFLRYVDQMEEVHRAQPLSMGWCLSCHRNAVDHVRPPEEVFNLSKPTDSWTKDQRLELIKRYDLHPNDNCSTCHR